MQDTTNVLDFYHYNDTDVHKIIRHVCKDPDRWEDSRSNVYLNLLLGNALQGFDASRSRFSSYIYAVVNNSIYSIYHQEQSHLHDELTDEHPVPEPVPYETKDRIERFHDFVQGSCIGDATAALDYFLYKLEGRAVIGLGQGARNQYKRLLKQFLFLEQIIN